MAKTELAIPQNQIKAALKEIGIDHKVTQEQRKSRPNRPPRKLEGRQQRTARNIFNDYQPDSRK